MGKGQKKQNHRSAIICPMTRVLCQIFKENNLKPRCLKYLPSRGWFQHLKFHQTFQMTQWTWTPPKPMGTRSSIRTKLLQELRSNPRSLLETVRSLCLSFETSTTKQTSYKLHQAPTTRLQHHATPSWPPHRPPRSLAQLTTWSHCSCAFEHYENLGTKYKQPMQQ